MKFNLVKLLVLISVFVGLDAVAQSPLPVPTLESHKEFLVGEWKSSAPTIIAFKDPFCPYCLKALEKKDELENVNLFLFWYPIFGEKSDQRVAEFFLCDSPVGANVIKAVLAHTSPNCTGKSHTELEAINKQFYEAYSPPGVPAFYLGGRKVSFAEVKSIQPEGSSGISLEWDRYVLNQLMNGSASGKKAALYISEKLPEKKVRKIVEALKTDNEYQWYVFPSTSSQLSRKVCFLAQFDCALNKEKLLSSSQELALLYGIDSGENSQIIINGRLVNSGHLPNSLQKVSLLIH